MKRIRKGSIIFLNYGIILRDKLIFLVCKVFVILYFLLIIVLFWGMIDLVLVVRLVIEIYIIYDYMRYYCELISKIWLKFVCIEILK